MVEKATCLFLSRRSGDSAVHKAPTSPTILLTYHICCWYPPPKFFGLRHAKGLGKVNPIENAFKA